MRKILTKEFFDKPVVTVAEGLLGKFLVRRIGDQTLAVMITETEAYDGPRDKACHARFGRTPRTEVMFGEAGRFYVYFNYGIHWLLNIVTGPVDYPAAVLIRAGVPAQVASSKWQVAKPIQGPARLTKYLMIDKTLNRKPANKQSGLWVEDRGIRIPSKQILATPRVGVEYAGVWAKKLYNFQLVDNGIDL
ncbi:MAG: DNA-3-methyladenine glycosylase [Candidatus Liptonbacteria bacterium]|nr:DNA-3-methyladenine glycosylase [Candidatus Liptonbacteria bacterium]